MAYTNYIHRTPSSNGNRQKFTISTWIKRPEPAGQGWILTVDSYPSGNMFQYQLDTASYLGVQQYHGSSAQASLTTNTLLRDSNAWYHIVLRVDTTQSTAADRMRFYINGTEPNYNVTTYPSQDFEFQVNHTTKQSIGSREDTSTGSSVYYSHYHLCDGYSYAPTEFGETDSTTGQWKIKTNPSVSYGTNGFFIFKDGMNLSGSTVQDQSGQGNNLTLVGSSVETQDNPSNNFCTFNALLPQSNTGLSKGNTRFETTSGSGWKSMCGTLGMAKNSGKYYMEFKHLGGSYNGYGIADSKSGGIVDQINQIQTTYPGEAANSYGYLSQGELHYNASQTGTGWDSYTTNDIIGMAVDMDNMKLYYHKNGSYLQSGNPSAGTGGYSINDPVGEYFPTATVNAGIMCANFGNGDFDGTAISSEGTNASGIGKFEYDVPTGYTALSTKGLNE